MSETWTAEQQIHHMCTVIKDENGAEILTVRGSDDYGKALAERVCRAMNWESNASKAFDMLLMAVQQHCSAFETSSLPGGALIVGDLRRVATKATQVAIGAGLESTQEAR